MKRARAIIGGALFGAWLALAPSASAAGLEAAMKSMNADLEASLAELATLREKIQAEQLPLAKQLSQLEDELVAARKEKEAADKKSGDLSLNVVNLKSGIKAREDQNKYLSNLVDEYLRDLETRMHIGEVQRHRARFEENKRAMEAAELEKQFAARADVIAFSLDRIDELLGGHAFPGEAVDASGLVRKGQFLLLGPVAYFVSEDGAVAGLAEQQVNRNEPVVAPLDNAPELAATLRRIAGGTPAALPVDVTGGNARKLAATKETLTEHIIKGGLTMVPILGLALAALLVGLWKWVQMAGVKSASPKQVYTILTHLTEGRPDEARRLAGRIRGPIGEMLCAGIDHIREPRALIEEVLFEKVLYAKGRLNSLLPFIAVTASSAPLLGLLGTVTGMINTFKMITVYGTGDAQTLSGGISEALITTEWGLIVAIPAVLLYAYLSRKAKGLLDDMEKIAVSFLNRLPTTPPDADDLGGDRDGGDGGPEQMDRPLKTPPRSAPDLVPQMALETSRA
jgi:biopolymer transport protein ExbB